MELPIIEKKVIEPVDLVKYAGASGDFNEIHTVPQVAREKGLDGSIAHGMLLMGWAAGAIKEWFPDRRMLSFKVRFKAMAFPGTQLYVGGSYGEDNNGKVEIYDKEGEVKLSGEFTLQKL